MKKLFGVWFVATMLFTSVSIAEVRNVPRQYTTIQAAINDCNAGDQVVIAPGTYTGTGNRDIDFLGKAITVRGATGDPIDIIIDCNGSSIEPHRGVVFQTGEDVNSILNGLTITNGFILDCGSKGGAGINITNSSPTIENCIIASCDTELPPNCLGFCSGGGIFIEEGGPIISNSVISGNTIGEYGWGGAGIHLVSEKDVCIRNCVISGNRAIAHDYGSGGGIYKEGSGVLTIINCTIADNVAFERGGGIAGSTMRILNSIIWNNMASEGPQIFFSGFPGDNIVIDYSDIQGGWVGLGNIDIDPCFVNVATVLTADFDFSGEVDFRDFAEFAAKWQMKSFESGFKYDISIPTDGVIDELDLLVLANQWLSSNPAGSDYHLKSKGYRWHVHTEQWVWDSVNSRCIDAGMPGMSLGDELLAVEEDPDNALSGNLRINMGAYGGTAQASLGHYSRTTTWSRLCDATNDGIVDFSDFTVLAEDFGLENTGATFPADFDRDGKVGLSDIVKFAQDWLEATTWH